MDNFTFCPLIILENGTVFCDGKIENGNMESLECVRKTTTRSNSRKQPKVTNGSSSQQENPVP